MSGVPSADEIVEAAAALTRVLDANERARWAGSEDAFAMPPWEQWHRVSPRSGAVRSGHRDAVEHAIVFLEADPWCFGSGNRKASLFRALAVPDLTADQQARLDRVVLRLVRSGHRELAGALTLVRSRRGPSLRPALRSLLHDPDAAVAARALRLLLAARRPRLDAAGRARALEILRREPGRLTPSERRRTVEAALGAALTWRTEDTTT